MNEFKGTKGKWELKINEYGYNTSVFTDNSQNPNPFRTICVSRVNDQEQNNANLLLISKAPEMLEMLEKIMKTYNKGTQTYLDCQKLIKEATQI
jgi:hypothetical protein